MKAVDDPTSFAAIKHDTGHISMPSTTGSALIRSARKLSCLEEGWSRCASYATAVAIHHERQKKKPDERSDWLSTSVQAWEDSFRSGKIKNPPGVESTGIDDWSLSDLP